ATYFVARNDVDNATAYWIIKTVLENNADLGRANALGKFWTKEIALEPVKGVIPIHPGAEAYFKEIGIWK
ncbi:MAG: TAXI family TRAP transporter solute-binding subunit, partial [Candidatus Methylomirabilota bacterium]